MIEVFGLKNCDSCRKAMKALPEAKLVDVRADGVPEDVLRVAHAQFGDKLLNTRSTTWRGLTEAERASDPIALLVAHPTLMKRPLIRAGDAMTLGWSAQTEAEIRAAG